MSVSVPLLAEIWIVCARAWVCNVPVSPPASVEPALIQLWQLAGQRLLMEGLVIIRMAINTPSLFNWFEFMSSLCPLILTLPLHLSAAVQYNLSSPRFLCVWMLNTQLYQRLLSGSTGPSCLCVTANRCWMCYIVDMKQAAAWRDLAYFATRAWVNKG